MNDDELPQRDVDPLYPRPGRFEETLVRARRRRVRGAVVTAAVVTVVCGGGLAAAVTTTVGGGSAPPAASTTGSSVSSTRSGATSPGSTATSSAPGRHASARPGAGKTGHSGQGRRGGPGRAPGSGDEPSPSTATAPATSVPMTISGAVYRGRVTDSAGSPLAGIGVYEPGRSGARVLGTSGADGTFTVPCPSGPVLLAAGDFGGARGDSADPSLSDGDYTYAFVGGGTDLSAAGTPACVSAPSGSYPTTALDAGGSITLQETGAADPDAAQLPELDCTAASFACYQAVRAQDGTATYQGLPTGQYTLRDDSGHSQTVSVVAGQSTAIEWDLGGLSSPSPSVSDTPTSAPTS